ncbi:Pheromone-processing carboxypeptidase KEX1 [Armadillidium nasatum]|uniref:Carboxypeptidase n=1 Tax=Armadillidium nasatum TaxID=96803 RepID=A0A5N5SNC0_9CRUS|nr:Pheromone-processing carboxypeptidase KEX1 [Armadillidium nasatum]
MMDKYNLHYMRQGRAKRDILTLDPPCTDSSKERSYLNRDVARNALHIPSFVQDWELCRTLHDNNIRGVLYNGDVDMACNFLGNQWDIEELEFEDLGPSYQWHVNGQIAGFVKRYELLDFVTVRGSGHMVPTDKPAEALHLIDSFVGNVIYLESPACVGFSYSDDGSCGVSDEEVAEMNYRAIQSFYEKSIETESSSLTGESYAGVYIPTLSVRIVEGNDTFPINFGGFAIGNGLLSYENNDNSMMFFARYHALLGEDLWDEMVERCCDGGIEDRFGCNFHENYTAQCEVSVLKALKILELDGLNLYNIYKPTATRNTSINARTLFDDMNRFRSLRREKGVGQTMDNSDSSERAYLNDPAVRAALHIPDTVQDWDRSSIFAYVRTVEYSDPYLKTLHDSGTVEERSMWYVNGQVAGYTKKLDLLDTVTIRGSGHMVGNVIFLESPACVGFSYDENGTCNTRDEDVAEQNYKALQHFYEKFPEYRDRELFITGESYGGIYIPTLCVRIVEGNDTYPINLGGFAIGNGLTSYKSNEDSMMFFGHYHALIGEECCGGVEDRFNCDFFLNMSGICEASWLKAVKILELDGINVYNIYSECEGLTSDDVSRETFDRINMFFNVNAPANNSREPTCTDSSNLRNYLNSPETREALHIPSFVQDWVICSNEVNLHYLRTVYNSQPYLRTLHDNGIRGVLYNGDVDMACNFLGNQWDIEGLEFDEIEERRMWYVNGQIAGYVQKFELLDFVTIRGSGHMVPSDKPAEALHMIAAFYFKFF